MVDVADDVNKDDVADSQDAQDDAPVKPAKGGAKAKEVVPMVLDDVIRAVSSLLVDNPQSLTVALVKEDGRSVYRFVEDSGSARTIRRKARKLLKDLWQAGAYNYTQLAEKLRVSDLDIQGLIDDEFSERNGLV